MRPEDIELDEEMDMPCPCQKCGEWFDLNDGYGSDKWFPNTVICRRCHREEEKEIERDEEIEELENEISDAENTLKHSCERLKELGVAPKVEESINKPALIEFITALAEGCENEEKEEWYSGLLSDLKIAWPDSKPTNNPNS